MGERPLKLELGCGDAPTEGYIHHDRIKHAAHVDCWWDLRIKWPVATSPSGVEGLLKDAGHFWNARTGWLYLERPVDEILALDVFEHLSVDIPPWLDQCWDLLADGGILDFRVPAWKHSLSYRDPTHKRVFHHETMLYWDPSHELQRRFGSLYFAESNRWWTQLDCRVENHDYRFRLAKIGREGARPS